MSVLALPVTRIVPTESSCNLYFSDAAEQPQCTGTSQLVGELQRGSVSGDWER
jgi:hypothetical protein